MRKNRTDENKNKHNKTKNKTKKAILKSITETIGTGHDEFGKKHINRVFQLVRGLKKDAKKLMVKEICEVLMESCA